MIVIPATTTPDESWPTRLQSTLLAGYTGSASRSQYLPAYHQPQPL